MRGCVRARMCVRASLFDYTHIINKLSYQRLDFYAQITVESKLSLVELSSNALSSAGSHIILSLSSLSF